MSFLRPLHLHPTRLEQTALDAWILHLLQLIRHHHLHTAQIRSLKESLSYDNFGGVLNESNKEKCCSKPVSLATYLDNLLPRQIQEELLHRGAQLLRRDLYNDLFPTFFCLIWRPDFRLLHLSNIPATVDKITILDFLEKKTNREVHRTESAKFRLFDNEGLSIEESYLMKRVLRGFPFLKNLVLWKVCDDAMLQIIGSKCTILETLDLWRSLNVTDVGIDVLIREAEESTLIQTLKRIVTKETSVTAKGTFEVLTYFKNLEYIDFSHGAVVKELLTQVQNRIHSKRRYGLKSLFFPAENSYVIPEVLRAFPKLEELTLCLWTSVTSVGSMEAKDLSHIHSLKLGGIHSHRIMSDFVTLIGPQLTALKLETIHVDIQLDFIGSGCVNLEELHIINARVATNHTNCDTDMSYFSKLKLIYFFLVQYIVNDDKLPPTSALHCLLTHAQSLEGIQATGSPSLLDDHLGKIITRNPFSNLRRFILTSSAFQEPELQPLPLSATSALRLVDHCPQIQCIGNLRHWTVSPAERKLLLRQIHCRHGLLCSSENELKLQAA